MLNWRPEVLWKDSWQWIAGAVRWLESVRCCFEVRSTISSVQWSFSVVEGIRFRRDQTAKSADAQHSDQWNCGHRILLSLQRLSYLKMSVTGQSGYLVPIILLVCGHLYLLDKMMKWVERKKYQQSPGCDGTPFTDAFSSDLQSYRLRDNPHSAPVQQHLQKQLMLVKSIYLLFWW